VSYAMVLKAEVVALGTEVGTQRKQRTPEWGQVNNPLMPMANVMDTMADERLSEMEAQVLANIQRGNRR